MMQKAVDYMKINGYPMPVLLDYDMKVARNYWVRGVPGNLSSIKKAL